MFRKTAALLLALVMLLTVSSCSKSSSWEKQYDRGIKCLSEEKYDEAVDAFTAAIDLDDSRAQAYAGRGEASLATALAAAGDITEYDRMPQDAISAFEGAQADFRKAIELEPGEPDYYRTAADINVAMGRSERALSILAQGYDATGSAELKDQLDQMKLSTSYEFPDFTDDLNLPDGSSSEEEDPGSGDDSSQEAEPEPETSTPAASSSEPEPEEPEPEAPKTDADIYADWLSSGGWASISGGTTYGYDIHSSAAQIATSLADIDGDGTGELLVSVVYTDHVGPMGSEVFGALLDCSGGSVSIVKTTYHGGGASGGETLSFLYDTQNRTHVLAVQGYTQDGEFYHREYLEVYSGGSLTVTAAALCYATDESLGSSYSGEVEALRSATDQYQEADGALYAWQANGAYVSEADYYAVSDRFTGPVSPEFELSPVTLDSPVPRG